MTITIDGYTWFYAVCSGAKNVISQQKNLNKINVFPVADGDTGNNLSSLMRSILQYATPDKSFYKTAYSIAQASLTGARGNSGTIFAQFFQGLTPSSEKNEMSSQELADQIDQAAHVAKEAVMEPVLGTILTVMADWGKACQDIKQKAQNCKELFQTSLDSAKKSLESTKQYLEVLRKADVVDAGAQGFVYFLEGICNYLNNPKAESVILMDASTELVLELGHHHAETVPVFRYCTELLLTDSTLAIAKIKEKISNYGDSIVLAGSEKKCRIHLHTNDPVSLVKAVEEFAVIQYQKAEDMLRQYQMTQEKTSKIALVIDSSADLPKELIDQNQIHIIPFTIQIKNHEYLDRLTIDTADIYRQMRDEDAKVLTSLPNITLAENTFKQLKGTYDSVIAITIASVQSGTYQLFNKAVQKSEISQIHIIDSKKNAIAHGLLVLEAARLIRENWNFQDIVEHIEKIRNFVNIYAVMKDVKYAVRSGRISKNKARIAQFFKLKVIISLDLEGNGIIWKKALGFSSALDKIIHLMYTQKHKIQQYAIAHADNLDGASQLARKLESIVGFPPAYIVPVSATVGIHIGPGAIGVATLLKS